MEYLRFMNNIALIGEYLKELEEIANELSDKK